MRNAKRENLITIMFGLRGDLKNGKLNIFFIKSFRTSNGVKSKIIVEPMTSAKLAKKSA